MTPPDWSESSGRDELTSPPSDTSRRRYVVALGTVALAGCSALGESSSFQTFERRLRERNVDLKRISEDFRRWIVEYFPDRASEHAFESEQATVASVYAATVPTPAENPNHASLKCILFDERRVRTGSYEIRAEWARAYATEELTESAYLERVRSTLGE